MVEWIIIVGPQWIGLLYLGVIVVEGYLMVRQQRLIIMVR